MVYVFDSMSFAMCIVKQKGATPGNGISGISAHVRRGVQFSKGDSSKARGHTQKKQNPVNGLVP
jgi:hypothetical protein